MIVNVFKVDLFPDCSFFSLFDPLAFPSIPFCSLVNSPLLQALFGLIVTLPSRALMNLIIYYEGWYL